MLAEYNPIPHRIDIVKDFFMFFIFFIIYINIDFSLIVYSAPGELQFIGALFLVNFNFYCFLPTKLQVSPIKAKKKIIQSYTKCNTLICRALYGRGVIIQNYTTLDFCNILYNFVYNPNRYLDCGQKK